MRDALRYCMWSVLVVAIIGALAGCAHGPHVHVDNPAPVEVPIVVTAACVHDADIPAMPAKVGSQLTGDARHDLDIVAPALIITRAALDKARALLLGCVAISDISKEK